MSGLLTRDAILAAADLPHVDVAVPEWGGTVRIRTMTGTERDEWEASLMATNGDDRAVNLKNLRARLVALTAVGEDGARLFNSNGDVEQIGGKSARALDRIFTAARRLNAVTKGDVEELTSFSDGAPSADTTSA